MGTSQSSTNNCSPSFPLLAAQQVECKTTIEKTHLMTEEGFTYLCKAYNLDRYCIRTSVQMHILGLFQCEHSYLVATFSGKCYEIRIASENIARLDFQEIDGKSLKERKLGVNLLHKNLPKDNYFAEINTVDSSKTGKGQIITIHIGKEFPPRSLKETFNNPAIINGVFSIVFPETGFPKDFPDPLVPQLRVKLELIPHQTNFDHQGTFVPPFPGQLDFIPSAPEAPLS